ELLLQLPYAPVSYTHHNEWLIRAKNFERFCKSITKSGCNILDLGCGNGWMTHKLYQCGHTLTGADINLPELEQAERVFGTNNKLQWVYTDILKDGVINEPFDMIVLGASCQYFDNILMLTDLLKIYLKPGGEIHLLDSFFYTPQNINAARKRTAAYYSNLGFPLMSSYYQHHLISDLKNAGYRKKYPSIFSRSKSPEWWVLKV